MKKVLKITAVTTLLSLGLAFSSYAGQWKQGTGANAGKWWYDEDNGTYATNGWRWIDGDGDGIAENYCFDQSGWLYVSTETPDKKTVDANGARTQDGKVVTMNVNSGDTTYTVDGTGTLEPKTYNGIEFSLDNLGYSNMAIGSIMYPKANSVTAEHILEYKRYYETGTDNYWLGAKQKERVNAFISEWKSKNINNSMTEDQKARKIYDWLVDNVTYDAQEPYNQSSYGAFIDRRCVCGGFANAFMSLGKACGLDVKYVFEIEHAFNIVKLDGKWYAVDATKKYYKNKDTSSAYYYKDIPEGDKSIEEKVQKRENKESKRIEEIKTSNEKNMERAKKNFESGAVFQADDEKLIPSLLQYINEQVNTNVKSSQPITAVIYTGGRNFQEFNKQRFSYNGFTGKLDEVIEHEIIGKTINGYYIGNYSNCVIDYQKNKETDGTSIFVTTWKDKDGKDYIIFRVALNPRDRVTASKGE